MMLRLALVLCETAGRVLPVGRERWADAMIAELSQADDDRTALVFAGGCLIAAVRERVRDTDSQFVAGLWSIAVVTALFAVLRFACAARGVAVLVGGNDGMHEALLRQGADRALMANYESARPIVIGCFVVLGCAQLVAAWFLSREELRRFLFAWFFAFAVAGIAVVIQLSIVWNPDGVPSEFHALLLQAVAVPALCAWLRHRQGRSGRI